MDNKVVSLAKFVTSKPWLVVIMTLVIIFATAAGMKRLSVSGDYKVFFKEDNAQLQAFEETQKRYTKNDSVLIVLAPEDGDVFSKKSLEALGWLTEEAWQTPFSIRVDSITNYQHSWAEGDELIVRELVEDPANVTPEQAERARQIATKEPLLVNRLISPDGKVTAVNINIHFRSTNPNTELQEVLNHAKELRANFEQRYPEIKTYMTGNVVMNGAFRDATRSDMRQLMPIMMLVLATLLIFFLRSVSGTISIFVSIFLSIMFAMGFIGWAGATISAPVASAPTIILTMVVANSVHILVAFFQEMRKGLEKQAAMIESLRLNFQPVILTNVTTILGFLSMNFSEAPPFHLLGNTVALGLVATFILSITFMPAMMMLLPVKLSKKEDPWPARMRRLAEFVLNNRRMLLFSGAAIILVLSSFTVKNEFNDEFHKYFSTSTEFRQSTDFTIDNLTGIYIVDYSLPSGAPEGISLPEYQRKLEEFSEWFKQQPEVLHSNSFTDISKRLNKNMNADDPAFYTIPDNKQLAAQYLLLYEMSLPYGLDLNNQVNLNKSSSRLSVTLGAVSSNDMLAFEKRATQWLKENGLPPMQNAIGTGPSIMFAHIGQINAKSMLNGTILALVMISFLLILALRSLKMGAISLIPNLIPAAVAFGIWGIFVGEIGMSLAVVAGMTLGIVVDDTVHFLSKYLRAKREHKLSSEDSVRYAFESVGVALVITTLVLVAGFLILAMSDFKMNSDMGLMTAVTLMVALVADFLFLPPILTTMEKKSND